MQRDTASFRDPCGFVFHREGRMYRQVNRSYADHYDRLIASGLYDELAGLGLLVPHSEVDLELAADENAYRVVAPERIPFVSYPAEWCFSQLKSAALLTLRVQRNALAKGMILKDASAFNVQFLGVRPVFIDTLSFETYREGQPWVAYRQFCEHFLSPLLLLSMVDPRLGRLLSRFLEGIPLDMASRMLPRRTWLKPSLALHIHLHARAIERYGRRRLGSSRWDKAISKRSLEGLVASLTGLVEGMSWNPSATEWASYDTEHGYASESLQAKDRFVQETVEEWRPVTVWDLGANTGRYSRIAATAVGRVVSIDGDPGAVEVNYRQTRKLGAENILPLCVDLTDPTPATGWAGRERASLADRGPADLVFALALVHHLALGRNVPLGHIARWLRQLGPRLVVEFVPKSDPQAQRLLVSREDVFADYDRETFERRFLELYETVRVAQLPDSERVLYALVARPDEALPEM
jgi:ribosomal protein L11 methylase PrmA